MPRLPVLDILHRGVVYSLVGLSIWGIGMSVAVHRDTIQRGKGQYMAKKEVAAQIEKIEEEKEISLAEAAQSVLSSRRA